MMMPALMYFMPTFTLLFAVGYVSSYLICDGFLDIYKRVQPQTKA